MRTASSIAARPSAPWPTSRSRMDRLYSDPPRLRPSACSADHRRKQGQAGSPPTHRQSGGATGSRPPTGIPPRTPKAFSVAASYRVREQLMCVRIKLRRARSEDLESEKQQVRTGGAESGAVRPRCPCRAAGVTGSPRPTRVGPAGCPDQQAVHRADLGAPDALGRRLPVVVSPGCRGSSRDRLGGGVLERGVGGRRLESEAGLQLHS